eukprot:ANDGO_02522.mRNA.1 Vegetative incompatibility protein HET-E-1
MKIHIKEEEVVLVILDYLKHRGFYQALSSLESESKVTLETYGQELLFLRSLVLEGAWDDVCAFLSPLQTRVDFDYKAALFAVKKQKFLEMLSSEKLSPAVVELVDGLKELEDKCSREEFNSLCYVLTLKKLQDHPDFSTWTVYHGRVETFEMLKPLFSRVYDHHEKQAEKSNVSKMEPGRLVKLFRDALLFQISAYEAVEKKRRVTTDGGGSELGAKNGPVYGSLLHDFPEGVKVTALDSVRAQLPEVVVDTDGNGSHDDSKGIRTRAFNAAVHQSVQLPARNRPAQHSQAAMRDFQAAAFRVAGNPSSTTVVGRSVAQPLPKSADRLPRSASAGRSSAVQQQGSQNPAQMQQATRGLRPQSARPEPQAGPKKKPVSFFVAADGVRSNDEDGNDNFIKDNDNNDNGRDIEDVQEPEFGDLYPDLSSPTSQSGQGQERVVGADEGEEQRQPSMTRSSSVSSGSARSVPRLSDSSVPSYASEAVGSDPFGHEEEQQQSPAFGGRDAGPVSVPAPAPVSSNRSLVLSRGDKESVAQGFRPIQQRNSEGRRGGEPMESILETTPKSFKFRSFDFLQDSQALRSVSFAPAGTYLAVGSNSKTLRTCSFSSLNTQSQQNVPLSPLALLSSLHPLQILWEAHKYHAGSIYCTAFSDDGMFLASGSNDRLVKVSCFHEQQAVSTVTLPGHSGTVRSVSFACGHPTHLFSGGDCTIKLWDVQAESVLKECSVAAASSEDVPEVLSVSPLRNPLNAHCVLSGSSDGVLRLHDFRSTNPSEWTIDLQGGEIWSLCAGYTGLSDGRAFAGLRDGRVAVVDYRRGIVDSFLDMCHRDECRSLSLSACGRYLASASFDKSICITDLSSMTVVSRILDAHQDRVVSVQFHPLTSDIMASTATDRKVTLWVNDAA